MVNLLTFFRVSLFEHLLAFHTHPGRANHWTDLLAAGLLEFKAFTLFSFLFGMGVCIQVDRAEQRHLDSGRFLFRRFAVLFGLGLLHGVFLSNGDILCLYAACGLLMLPMTKFKSATLISIAILAIAVSSAPIYGSIFPTEGAMRADATAATHIYGQGSFMEILKFRWHETRHLIGPLLVNCLPRTLGLMLLGIVAWRSDIVRRSGRHRHLLWKIAIVGGLLGAAGTAYLMISASSGTPATAWGPLFETFACLSLASAYAAMIVLWADSDGGSRLKQMLGAAGQMALSNYLMQSVIFGLIFYGYGFGLLGQLGSASVAGMGVIVYVLQLAFSRAWLRKFRFGPFEWLWRSLTYGHRQQISRVR